MFTDVSAEVDMFWSSSRYLYIKDQELRWLLQVDSGVTPGDNVKMKHRSRCVF